MIHFNSRAFLKISLTLACLILLDQVTKNAAPTPVFNPGFFLGSLAWSSPFYRIFCTLGLLSICVMCISFVQFLIVKSAPLVCFSLSVFEAGLIGNGIDKVRFGAVRDFIEVSLFQPSFIFNLADAFQWGSIAVILFSIWRNPGRIWPENNLRNSYLIFPFSQLRIVAVSLLILISASAANFLFFMAYLKMNSALGTFREISVCFFVFTLILILIVGTFSLIWSHRVYGPFQAVIRQLKQMKGSERSPIKVRKSDELECAGEILSLINEIEEKR